MTVTGDVAVQDVGLPVLMRICCVCCAIVGAAAASTAVARTAISFFMGISCGRHLLSRKLGARRQRVQCPRTARRCQGASAPAYGGWPTSDPTYHRGAPHLDFEMWVRRILMDG